jgi:flagellar hook-associated protein 3 FlgL
MSIIRSTWHGRLDLLTREFGRVATRLGKAQEIATTGLKYTRASDDPGRTGRILRTREQAEDQKVWQQNATFAEGLLNGADTALDELAAAVAQARELAVQMSSETLSDADRINGATTATGIFEKVLDLANSSYGDRYLFSGTAWDTQAYSAAGVYQGDTGEPEVPVGEGVTVATGFDGSDLLQGASGDVIGAVSNLVAALTGGTSAAVQSALDDLDAATDQISIARTTVGIEMDLALDSHDLSLSIDVELARQLSDLTEADTVEAFTRMFELQSTYEASLQITAQARTNLLFNRI